MNRGLGQGCWGGGCLLELVSVSHWGQAVPLWKGEGAGSSRLTERSSNPSSLSIGRTLGSTPLSPPPSSASKWSSRLEVAASRWIASTVYWLRAAKIWSRLEAWSRQRALGSTDQSQGVSSVAPATVRAQAPVAAITWQGLALHPSHYYRKRQVCKRVSTSKIHHGFFPV